MIDFYFDVSSPWTYLAFRNIQPMAADLKVNIYWRPVLVGGIFNTVNQRMYASREDSNSPRNRYVLKDLQDCARQTGIKIVFPPKVFPVNSVKAMRGCIWVAQNTESKQHLLAFIEATFAAYFTQQQDISQDDVLADICQSLRIDAAAFAQGIAQPDIKQALKANTDEAIARGAFGVPSFFVGSDMYFGNDRLDLLRLAVLKAKT
ncbi:MAG: 2-hydroxychromene-2-carboxylate isomerase [Polaromonas sp.]